MECAKNRQHPEDRFNGKTSQPWKKWQTQFDRCLGIERYQVNPDQNRHPTCDRNNPISLRFQNFVEVSRPI